MFKLITRTIFQHIRSMYLPISNCHTNCKTVPASLLEILKNKIDIFNCYKLLCRALLRNSDRNRVNS